MCCDAAKLAPGLFPIELTAQRTWICWRCKAELVVFCSAFAPAARRGAAGGANGLRWLMRRSEFSSLKRAASKSMTVWGPLQREHARV